MKPLMLFAITALSLSAACGELDDPDTELTAETSSELSVYSWLGRGGTGAVSYNGGQVANLNGVAYIVHGGDCPSWWDTCGGDNTHEIYWKKQGSDGWWSGSSRIGSQRSAYRVSLAAFNGYLYMLHSGSSSANEVWMSRFSPASQTWSADTRLAFTSRGGAPAMAVHNGVLRIVGVNPSTNQLWTAVMSASGAWSAPASLAGHYSASRVTAASYNGRYYIAHRAGNGTYIVYNSAADGYTFGADQYIYAAAGSAIQGTEPSIYAYNGYLHLVHRRPGSLAVWWTYFDGYSWPTEQTVPNNASHSEPTLGMGTWGLLLLTSHSSSPSDDWNRPLYNELFL